MSGFNLVFLVFAGFFSIFYGLKAFKIFKVTVPKTKKYSAWAWHQRWFNFVGSVVGWTALWFLIQKAMTVLPSSYTLTINVWDAVMFFLAFIGITGHLPYTMMGLIKSIGDLAKLLLKNIIDFASKSKP